MVLSPRGQIHATDLGVTVFSRICRWTLTWLQLTTVFKKTHRHFSQNKQMSEKNSPQHLNFRGYELRHTVKLQGGEMRISSD